MSVRMGVTSSKNVGWTRMASGVSGRAPVSPGAEPLVSGTACQKVGWPCPPVHPVATPLSVRLSVMASVVTDQAHTHTRTCCVRRVRVSA